MRTAIRNSSRPRIAAALLAAALSTALSAPPGAALAGDDWPAFRGPTGDGKTDAKGLPVRWDETTNIAWKVAIHDKGWSSPVILGKQVWMTTATEDGKKLFAVCVDKDTGKVVHDLTVFEVEKPQFCHKFNSYASSTPALEEGRVYVHFGSAGTACLDTATGKKLWERTDLPCDHFRGAGSSPIIHGDLLILTFDGFDLQYLAALDKATGKTVWRHDRKLTYDKNDGDWKKAYSTPAVVTVGGKAMVVSPSAQCTEALDPATGELIWRVNHGGMNAAARPLFDPARGRLYLTTGYGGLQLFSLNPAGAGDLPKSAVDWNYNKGVPTRPSLIQQGAEIYMIADNGVITVVSTADGKEVAKKRVAGNFSASPLLAEGRLYFANEEGATYVVEANRELKELAANKLSAGCMASPAVSGKALFLRTKTHLYRIEEK